MSTMHCDIAVVGGGVVGAAAALALSQAGFDVRLLERGAAPPAPSADYDLRVYAISPASARLLTQLGVWDRLDAARVCEYEAMRVWGLQAQRALNFSAADIGRHSLGWIAEQSRLLHALWQALPPQVIAAGQSPVSVDFNADGVQLQLADGATLKAKLVIAAEGAQSPLRDWAGIETTGWSYEQNALVAHVHTSKPHGGCALQRFLPSGPLAFLPLADGRRSIVWSLPSAEAERLRALPEAEFLSELAAAIHHEAGDITAPTPRLLFPLRLMHAREYVRPGLALVGDSAHVVHPLAGQGVNLGLGDAAELASQLINARDAGNAWHSERVLRRYERARQAANLEMLTLTDLLDRAFRQPAAGLPKLLNFGLSAVDGAGPIKQWLVRQALG